MRAFFKVTISFMSIIGLFLGLSILTVSILGITDLIVVNQDTIRHYAYAFLVEDQPIEFLADGEYTVYKTYLRGEDIHIEIPKVDDILPVNEEDPTKYFKGWDWTGDGLIDSSYPKKAYYSLAAHAVFDVVYPEKSEESTSIASDSLPTIFSPAKGGNQ